ncbi:MAG: geranylgeranylglyceryl/heptaprenylglyceryl phosphate synthase [Euryarchaeota archaeon]|nr:geranylgeranylglyceryl/heptaprenylglyceryl phosphate synthase [Euryarchaeota archaeon]
MKVIEYIESKVRDEKLHMTLIDPDDQSPKESAKIAMEARNAGTDAIMIGGSTGITREIMDETIKEIKNAVELPVIIFPNSASVLSPYADALYFMSLLNSRSVDMLIGQQIKGAVYVKKLGIEPIPMGYIIVEPGMTVGRVGQAKLIPRAHPEEAVAYALAAQYFGMRLVYLEAGSGAPEPVPPEMVSMVKNEIDIPLIVGGGIRTPEKARAIARAGADIIVTGTIVEMVENIEEELGKIISAIKE